MSQGTAHASASAGSKSSGLLAVSRRWLLVSLDLGSARRMAGVAGAATVLASTSVGKERALDDWVVGLIAEGRGAELGLGRQFADCFRFSDGSNALTRQLIDTGNMLPWWSEPELKIAFFRPLASATHLLDHWLWPKSAIAMHLHSLAWFLSLLGAVALVYRRLSGSLPLAGLAFALYALDDVHGLTVAWLCNRNALIAGAASCLSLYWHDRWRREGHRTRWLAGLAFLLSLSASEIAVGGLAYLIAYALFMDPRPRRERLLSVAPYLAIASSWHWLCSRAGYGVVGSGGYVDPIEDPLGFLREAPLRWLGLIQGQFGLIPSDLLALGESAWRPLWLVSACFTLVACVWLLGSHCNDARGRFWSCGAVLSLLPLAAAFPSDRLLLFVGLGSTALLARLFQAFSGATRSTQTRAGLRNAAVVGLLLIHGLWAPALLPIRAAELRVLASAEQQGIDRWLEGSERSSQTVMVLSAPSLLLANYAQARRALLGLSRPAHLYVLSATDSDLRVQRSSASELILTPQLGFLHSALERHYRATELPAGAEVALSTFSARILSTTADGRPQAVRISLSRPISEYVFLCWSAQGFSRCELPRLGQTIVFAHEDFGAAVLRAAWSARSSEASLHAQLDPGSKP